MRRGYKGMFLNDAGILQYFQPI